MADKISSYHRLRYNLRPFHGMEVHYIVKFVKSASGIVFSSFSCIGMMRCGILLL